MTDVESENGEQALSYAGRPAAGTNAEPPLVRPVTGAFLVAMSLMALPAVNAIAAIAVGSREPVAHWGIWVGATAALSPLVLPLVLICQGVLLFLSKPPRRTWLIWGTLLSAAAVLAAGWLLVQSFSLLPGPT